MIIISNPSVGNHCIRFNHCVALQPEINLNHYKNGSSNNQKN